MLKRTPQSYFTRMTKKVSRDTGRPGAFWLAVAVVAAWALTGPIFDYSNTWQLVINTATTIVTFLMVFLIQATQYRDAEAVQVKLDEIIRATRGAHNELLDLEELEAQDLERIRKDYQRLAKHARVSLRRGLPDTNVPEVDDRD